MEKSGYQVVINGKVLQIEDLTRGELIAELISAIDFIEELDNIHDAYRIKMSNKIDNWRVGR